MALQQIRFLGSKEQFCERHKLQILDPTQTCIVNCVVVIMKRKLSNACYFTANKCITAQAVATGIGSAVVVVINASL